MEDTSYAGLVYSNGKSHGHFYIQAMLLKCCLYRLLVF